MLTITIMLAIFISCVVGKPTSRNMHIIESLDVIPDDFVESGAAAASTSVQLRIALTQSDITGLERELYAVSTPDSDRYGQHLSKEEVEEYVKPSSETIKLVNDWLNGNGISSTVISPAGDWIQISIPVGKANEILDTEFKVYTRQSTGDQTIRTLSYSIPADLKDHIDLIHPTIAFPSQSSLKPIISSPSSLTSSSTSTTSSRNTTLPLTNRNSVICTGAYTILPQCILSLYNIPSTQATQPSNILAVSGFADQWANIADLQEFLEAFRPDIPSGTSFSLYTLDGGSNPQIASETSLLANAGIQYTVGVASSVPVTYISVGDQNFDGLDGFIDLMNYLLDMVTPPRVLTTAYGFNENVVPLPLANQFCNAVMQLGARGTSVIFASGDGGVAGLASQQCTNFVPTFPSGCPFLTSVGATYYIPETGGGFTSGGFSALFPRPSYQSEAVQTYLNSLGSTNAGLFNRLGRAYPDVSAIGSNMEIVYMQLGAILYGTTFSAAIFASVIAVLNDELITADKDPLGFLNPLLYSEAGAAAFNDITTGNNPGCHTNGFPASVGWDPVTGLGTPNFAKLMTAFGL